MSLQQLLDFFSFILTTIEMLDTFTFVLYSWLENWFFFGWTSWIPAVGVRTLSSWDAISFWMDVGYPWPAVVYRLSWLSANKASITTLLFFIMDRAPALSYALFSPVGAVRGAVRSPSETGSSLLELICMKHVVN